jgi:hypothetical protein
MNDILAQDEEVARVQAAWRARLLRKLVEGRRPYDPRALRLVTTRWVASWFDDYGSDELLTVPDEVDLWLDCMAGAARGKEPTWGLLAAMDLSRAGRAHVGPPDRSYRARAREQEAVAT